MKSLFFPIKDQNELAKVVFKERKSLIGLFQPQINEDKMPLLLETFQVIVAIKLLEDLQKVMTRKRFLPTYGYLILTIKGACSISMKAPFLTKQTGAFR